jgi:hypothetical protein
MLREIAEHTLSHCEKRVLSGLIAMGLVITLAAPATSAAEIRVLPAPTVRPILGDAQGLAVTVNAAGAPAALKPSLDLHETAGRPSSLSKETPTWKTVTLGTYRSTNALLEALDSEGCGRTGQDLARHETRLIAVSNGRPKARPLCSLGTSAAEIIGSPAFNLSKRKRELDLVVLSPPELGLAANGEYPLEEIYGRAERLGFGLCPAEVGAQLRLQYLDQPLGEFLHIAMRPIAQYDGLLSDLTVANGGAGLLLLGGDARPNVRFFAINKFVFLRPR